LEIKKMQFKTMKWEDRKKIIAAEKDELTQCVPKIGHTCPKCSTTMSPQRPKSLCGVVPSYDYKCGKCGTFVSGATGVVG